MTRLIGDLLARRANETFVGRTEELGTLLSLLDDGPRMLFLHGIAGIGKSALLEQFANQARSHGAVVVSLNCQTIEPTERGFLYALGEAIGGRLFTAGEAAERLKYLGDPVILSLDSYEVFRLMDTWMRQVFVPALPDSVRVTFVGRDTPPLAWLVSAGWQGLVRTIGLGPLDEPESVELLLHSAVGAEAARQINRFAQGHPLALKLAASVGTERRDPDKVMTAQGFQLVIQELTKLYLVDVKDPLTRRAIDAASVVRRVTISLIQSMLPDAAPQDAFDRLKALPFVRSGRDGLQLHDLVQQAIGASLRAGDPNRYQEYRRLAWRCLSTESRRTSLQELWRYTADLLYLIENPVVREAFFPTGAYQYVVEPARADDASAIKALTRLHEPAPGANLIDDWWSKVPQAFRVVRDPDGTVAGFYLMFDPSTVNDLFLRTDPIVHQWQSHLRTDPVPDHQRVLFLRRWLDREHGEKPSPVQAACWLDIKRTYMEMRPHLRRVYLSVRDLADYAPVAHRLGFQPLSTAGIDVDGNSYEDAVLDFGPSSVDGWLSGLAASELGLEESDLFDRHAHELVLDGNRIKLTKLEFEVLLYMYQRRDKAVTRASLIEDVWGWKHTGSNVIEAVVRSLRKKLGTRASALETIRGSGYRLRNLAPARD